MNCNEGCERSWDCGCVMQCCDFDNVWEAHMDTGCDFSLNGEIAEALNAQSRTQMNTETETKHTMMIDRILEKGFKPKKLAKKVMKFSEQRDDKAKTLAKLQRKCRKARRREDDEEEEDDDLQMDKEEYYAMLAAMQNARTQGTVQIMGEEFKLSDMRKRDLESALELIGYEISDMTEMIKKLRKKKKKGKCDRS